MRVYLAGPMTGIPQFNIPAFDNEALRLRAVNVDVVSPAELDGFEMRQHLLKSATGSVEDYPEGMTWGQFLGRDIELLVDDGIEAVVVLPGWENSKGARLETFVASAIMGLDVIRTLPEEQVPIGHDGELFFETVPRLELIRAWAAEPAVTLRAGVFGA